MKPNLANRCLWAAWGGLVLVLAGLGAAGSRTPALALVNESPSVPRGLYIRAPGAGLKRGDTVALPQPQAARVYLADLGLPAEVLLLKRAAGIRGDHVCRTGNILHVAGRQVAAPEHDRRGARLPQWRGCRRLESGEVFLLGDTAESFDSRYFGPVRVTELDGVFRETIRW